MKIKSKMKNPKYLWIFDHPEGLISVAANTKSEARSLVKKQTKKKLQVGSGKNLFMLPNLTKEKENA